MRTWVQVALLVASALVIVLVLGPLVGALELGILAALLVAGTALVLRRAHKRRAPVPD